MPFKWVQCRVCARTMHIDSFPEPYHRALKKTGCGTCKKCDGSTYASQLTSSSIMPIHAFIAKCEEQI